MRAIPSEEECLDMLERAGCSEKIIEHCCVVMSVAVSLARRAGVDLDLVRAGALLHDIGRSRTHGIRHVTVGVDILRSFGLSESIIKIAQRHIGAGLAPGDVEDLGLPPGIYLPETIEEKIVCHSDNLVDGSSIIGIEDAIEDFEAKGLYSAAQRMMEIEGEISLLTGEGSDQLLREADPASRIRGPCSAYARRR